VVKIIMTPAQKKMMETHLELLTLLQGFRRLGRYSVPIASKDGGAICYEDAVRIDVLDDWVRRILPQIIKMMELEEQ